MLPSLFLAGVFFALWRQGRRRASMGLRLRYLAWDGRRSSARWLSFAVALFLASGLLPVAPAASLLVTALAVAMLHPWVLVRAVAAPLGLTRVAYGLGWLATTTFRSDPRGGASLAGALALTARARTAQAEREAVWLADRLAAVTPLRGAAVVAAGLLASFRGDEDGARSLLASVATMAPVACPPVARRLAHAYLAADAAAQGRWLDVTEHGLFLGQGGRAAWLLAAVARHLLGDPLAPGRLGLWLRWALSPHRRATLPLLRRALAAPAGAPPTPEAPVTPLVKTPEGDAFAAALSLHASLVMRPPQTVAAHDVGAIASAWDAALDEPATDRHLERRALELGASGAGAAASALRTAIEADLAAVISAPGFPRAELRSRSRTVERVVRRLRDERLTEIEMVSDAIRRRADELRALPAIDEWREWLALRREYERGVEVGGLAFRRLAFPKVHPDLCHLSVWLFNTRKERAVGNVIFRFLLCEATAVGDEAGVALQAKNVACGT